MGKKELIQEIVTNEIIKALENGVIPWNKPWVNGMNRNIKSKAAYRGFNQVLLTMVANGTGYQNPYWGTFKQITEAGGRVRKGEHGTVVMYFQMVKASKNAGENESGAEMERLFPLLRYYKVFNLDQCENVESPAIIETVYTNKPATENAESIIAGYQKPPRVEHKNQARAFYRPSTDSITMPTMKQFKNDVGYYGTLFHELVHSTGAAHRLNRPEFVNSNGKDSAAYGAEELTAEIGATMLLNLSGFESGYIENAAAYCESWLAALKNDRGMIIKAASKAQAAMVHIAGEIQ